jgi:methionyl aminopeptidase
MAIPLRKPQEIAKLHKAAALVAQTLDYLQKNICAGMTLSEIDKMGEAYLCSLGAKPSFKGLYGFGGSVCTSLNEVVIHGLPSEKKVSQGDILGLDIGSNLDGYYGDAAITIPIGEITQADQQLIDCSKDALYYAIDSIHVGMRFKELSKILEDFIQERGYVPLRDFCGHGIGTKPHEEPSIPNYLDGKPKQGPKIKNGMVFCLEPMVCQKSSTPVVLEDKWSIVSQDGLRTSHYEHQIAIIDNKPVILTQL